MIVLYKGSRGRGKTLTMVKDAYQYYLDGFRILANLKLTFGENISNDEVLSLSQYSQLYNCVLVLDELQIFFDSRNFLRKENKDFSYFIQQIRKRNIIILGTAQYVNTIELRFRQHIDYIAIPKFNIKNNVCRVKYFDLTKLEDNNPRVKPVKVSFDATKIFPLYNTLEMLK